MGPPEIPLVFNLGKRMDVKKEGVEIVRGREEEDVYGRQTSGKPSLKK